MHAVICSKRVTCVTAHCAAAIAVLATVAALTLLPSVWNTSLATRQESFSVLGSFAYIKVLFL